MRLSSSNNMLRYERDNDELRRENAILKLEIARCAAGKSVSISDKEDAATNAELTELLSIQRKRIEGLEAGTRLLIGKMRRV